MNEFTITEKPFTPHDLLDLLKHLDRLNNVYLTTEVAKTLHYINNPPMIVLSTPCKNT